MDHTSVDVANLSFTVVVAGDEERGMDVVFIQNVQDVRCVNVRTVVEGQGDHSRLGAVDDARAAVGNGAQLCAGNIRRRRPWRDLQSIAASPVVYLAVRSGAVVLGLTAESVVE